MEYFLKKAKLQESATALRANIERIRYFTLYLSVKALRNFNLKTKKSPLITVGQFLYKLLIIN